MSGGQEMIGYKAAGGNVNALGFQSVTIAGGGNVIFSPKSPTFGPVGQTGADFVLGPISQLSPGSGIIMNGLRNLTLTGNNTYSGDTVINSGRLALTGSATINNSPNIAVATDAILDVTGRSDGKLTLVTGQTLSGNGTVYGSLQSGAGATISPGTSVGALTVTNAVILGGTNTMEIDKAAQTNDVIRGAASIQYGGTLNLVLLSDQFAQGDSFKLFYAGSYSGSFANIVPATPGADLGWDTSELTTTGTLKVGLPVSKPTIGTFTVTSGSVSLSGSGGLPNSTYSVLTSTNIALPLASWSVFTNGTFDGSGNFTISAPKPPGSPNFFRVQTP
jgi:autotransporter-associated beta strand protein